MGLPQMMASLVAPRHFQRSIPNHFIVRTAAVPSLRLVLRDLQTPAYIESNQYSTSPLGVHLEMTRPKSGRYSANRTQRRGPGPPPRLHIPSSFPICSTDGTKVFISVIDSWIQHGSPPGSLEIFRSFKLLILEITILTVWLCLVAPWIHRPCGGLRCVQ